MDISMDEARNEIAPVLEQILTDKKLGDDFAAKGVDALDHAGIKLSGSAREFFKCVDRTAAKEAIRSYRESGKKAGATQAAGSRALVVGFPAIALVIKGVRKPNR